MYKKQMYLAVLLSSCLWLTLPVAAEQIAIEVLDATIKDKRIDGANVFLQQSGEKTVTTQTDHQGKAVLNSHKLVDSSTMLILKKNGFSDLVVKCPCDGMSYAMSPVMKNLDGVRVVLSWAATPRDLDSHLVYPGNHVYFSNRIGVDANLDVDDRDGFGPETITVTNKRYGDSYVYAVHDYTNKSERSSTALASSQAKVFVYIGQSLIRTYQVPENIEGNLWTVFSLNADGNLNDIGRMSFSDSTGVKEQLVSNMLNEGVIGIGIGDETQARTLNQQGETAYHAKRYDEAIRLYNAAIEQDQGFSQAYSNLGLAYQKNNQIAEAIWANRKALALASGDEAETVRAASYYNIARIYENAGEYDNALRHYQLAKQQKGNPVYDKAIRRVEGKR